MEEAASWHVHPIPDSRDPSPSTRYPAGTVTFLFTDIEKSTDLWERDARAAHGVVTRYLAIVGQAVAAHGGVHFKTVGDGTQSAFAIAARAIGGALAAQMALREEHWPSDEARPRVRMALHAGAAEPHDGDYLAACLNRLSRLMEAAHGEQILLSQTVAALAGDDLPAEVTLESLGEFRLRDILQPEEIFQLRHPALRAEFPPLNVPGAIPHNLPAHPTPFLGRERETEEIVSLLLQPDVRLVTLTGTGGVGKTRLALRVAAEALESFPDGAFLIDLAAQSDAALVPAATATALGLREQPGQAVTESLVAYLRDRRTLLLFDNFEHLLPAATLVSTLLAAAPGTKVLATSRARLDLQGEHEYGVETLPVPDPAALPPLPELQRYDAVALFVARARALRPDFALTAENAAAVAAICQRVDGLPLAIELAAARVKLLPPAALLARLEHRLGTLVGGARDLPARQRTVRDTIAWSHDLLGPDEATLFRRLSIFAGDWTLAGAEALSALAGATLADPLTTLSALVDQNLVDERPNKASDEPRFAMLETIREFAAERLTESGEAYAVERAFEAFLIGKAEAAARELNGANQLLWLGRLEAEHDNLRAALRRAMDRRDGGTALGLALRLWEFWWARGYRSEGRAWLEQSLAITESASAADKAAAESALGKLTFDLGDYRAAEKHYRLSLKAHRQLSNAVAEAEALSALALIAVNKLAYGDARRLGEEALKITRQEGDRRGTAVALRVLGMVAREQGAYEHGLELFEESMTLGRELSDTAWTARIATQIGITHRLAGNAEQAQHFLEESRELHTELGDRYALAVIASHEGHLSYDTGNVGRAIALYAEALRDFNAVGGLEGVVEAIEFLAVAAATTGDDILALRLFGASETAREALHLPPRLDADEKRVASGLNQVTRSVGADAMTALAEGRTLSLEQARNAALHFAEAASAPQTVGS